MEIEIETEVDGEEITICADIDVTEVGEANSSEYWGSVVTEQQTSFEIDLNFVTCVMKGDESIPITPQHKQIVKEYIRDCRQEIIDKF